MEAANECHTDGNLDAIANPDKHSVRHAACREQRGIAHRRHHRRHHRGDRHPTFPGATHSHGRPCVNT